jgi:ubiquinone/menaquinone biosynthesis C-methylase UbiE
MSVRDEQAASFDQAADVYEKARPEYPAEAVDWLIPAGAKTVLDLGAGTGKFTRALAARGLEVIAVDPAPKMLAQLSAALPSATVHEGTAEDIPVADASVDAVFAAQAWHWVDQDAALPQVARVLKPGGTLGLIWNIRDEREPWVERLTVAMYGSEAESFVESSVRQLQAEDTSLAPGFGSAHIERGPFGEIESSVFDWKREFDRAGLLDLVRSRSYFITATPDAQSVILADVERLLDTDPDLAGADHWQMPYRTHVFRMTLPL